MPTNQAREAALGEVDIVPMAFLFLCIASWYQVIFCGICLSIEFAPVIDVILASVLFVDGSVVEAVNHAVDSQHVRLVRRHCSLGLYDHSRAPWQKTQLTSMLDEIRQKCGNEKNEIKEVWLLCRLCGGVEYSRTAEKSWLSPPQRPDWSEPIWTPESREVVQGCVRRKGGMEGDPGGGGWGEGTGAADCSSKPNTNPTLRSCMGRRLHFQV